MQDVFDVYNIARNYIITEFYSLDSNILLRLLDDKKLNITQALSDIPHIHEGYVEIIMAKREDNG